MRHAAQTVEQAPVNSALLNVVTPMGLSFEKNRLSIGENIGKAYGIIRYPQKVDVEWLSKLTNIPSTLVSIGFKPVDNGTLINGPYAPVGNRIMDCAEQYGGRVTFYVVGNRVNSYKSEIQRMYANGHEIGNHTQDHKYLQKLGAQEIRQQVETCNQAVAAITGEAPKTVRLPGGGKNSTVLANISQPIVLWNVDTLDWKTRNAASSVQTVLNQVKDGSVVLMHELYNASGDAAVTIIPALVERGYQLVTVSELAQFRGGLAGGTVYYSFHK